MGSRVSAPRFFSDGALPRAFATGNRIALTENIVRHLHVLRMSIGDAITLFDGAGGEFSTSLVELGKRNATVELTSFDPIERESPLQVKLVQALATSDKMDFIVQKAVELGVTSIQPISTERATLKLSGDRAEKRLAHWQAIVRAACEQCGRNRVPMVSDVMTLEAWLMLPAEGVRAMLHPEATAALQPAGDGAQPITLLIGPEGGFSPLELALAAKHGVAPVRFGPRVLRTETAGLAAIAVLNARFGDLR